MEGKIPRCGTKINTYARRDIFKRKGDRELRVKKKKNKRLRTAENITVDIENRA